MGGLFKLNWCSAACTGYSTVPSGIILATQRLPNNGCKPYFLFSALIFALFCGLFFGPAGNTTGKRYYYDFWEYNPSFDTWTPRAKFPDDAREGAIGFSIRNIGYLGIGLDSSNVNFGYNDDFWEYIPSTDSWSQISNFGGGLRRDAVTFSIVDTNYVGTGQFSTP